MVSVFMFSESFASYAVCINSIDYIQCYKKEILSIITYEHELLKGGIKVNYAFLTCTFNILRNIWRM